MRPRARRSRGAHLQGLRSGTQRRVAELPRVHELTRRLAQVRLRALSLHGDHQQRAVGSHTRTHQHQHTHTHTRHRNNTCSHAAHRACGHTSTIAPFHARVRRFTSLSVRSPAVPSCTSLTRRCASCSSARARSSRDTALDMRFAAVRVAAVASRARARMLRCHRTERNGTDRNRSEQYGTKQNGTEQNGAKDDGKRTE
jgi:hypothetical protein